jgi:hypothetical protein
MRSWTAALVWEDDDLAIAFVAVLVEILILMARAGRDGVVLFAVFVVAVGLVADFGRPKLDEVRHTLVFQPFLVRSLLILRPLTTRGWLSFLDQRVVDWVSQQNLFDHRPRDNLWMLLLTVQKELHVRG